MKVPAHRRALQLSLAVLALSAFLALTSATRAEASAVGSVGIGASAPNDIGGWSPVSSVRVDQPFGINVSFTTTSGLATGQEIYIRAPEGTVFSPNQSYFTMIINSPPGWGNLGFFATVLEGGRTIRLTIPSYVNDGQPIAPGSNIQLVIGSFQDQIEPPATPGPFGVEVWTTTDTDPVASGNTILTTLGLPAVGTPVNSGITATVNEFFDELVGVIVTDSRGNPLSGQSVTFTLPGAAGEPSGTFPGGTSQSTIVTNAAGAAPAPTIDANTVAGPWTVSWSGPNDLSGTIALTNEAAETSTVDLSLDPDQLPADGTSEAEATITVADEFGNPVTTGELTLETDENGPAVTQPVPAGEGVYTATVTASTAPGEFTLTARDESVTPPVSDSTVVRQERLPATAVTVELAPGSIPADGTSTTTARVKLLNALATAGAGTVTIKSSGGQAIGPVTEVAPGEFTATVRSSTTPGSSTVTATVDGSEPPVEGSATLVQTAVPPNPKPDPDCATDPSRCPSPDPSVRPVVRFKGGTKARIRAPRVTFRFRLVRGEAARFQCRLDKRPWRTCRSPKRIAVKRGRHVFRVRAIAPDGTKSQVIKRKFRRVK